MKSCWIGDRNTDEKIIGMEPEIDLEASGFGVIEDGIKTLVRALHDCGFRTVCSCAGHTNALEPLPWVAISASEITDCKLVKLFYALSQFNLSKGKDGSLPKAADTWVLCPQLVNGKSTLYLRPQALNEILSINEIKRLRKLGQELASFILAYCL